MRKPQILLTLLPLFMFASRSDGDEPISRQTAQQLVALLGHEQFAVRERASVQLIALGIDGANALAGGKESHNREIRHRSAKLYSLIAESDAQRRLEAFEKSDDPSQGYGLPGWRRFREIVGTDENSRALFLSMQRDERELIALLKGEGQLNREFALRCEILENSARFRATPTTTGTVAAFLFLATDERIEITPTVRRAVYMSCLDRDFISKISEGALRKPLGELVTAWMARDSGNEISNVLYLGLITRTESCMKYAKAVVSDPQSDADSRQYALLCFAQFGKESDIPLVEKMLADASPCDQARIANLVVVTQVRDVALATLVEITKQKHDEYGFDRLQRHRQQVFYPRTLGFTMQANRDAAIAAWHEYRRQEAE